MQTHHSNSKADQQLPEGRCHRDVGDVLEVGYSLSKSWGWCHGFRDVYYVKTYQMLQTAYILLSILYHNNAVKKKKKS